MSEHGGARTASPSNGRLLPAATALCAILLGLSTSLATSAVPSEWTHDHQLLVWGVVAALAAVSVALAVGRRPQRDDAPLLDYRIEAEEISGPIVVAESGSQVTAAALQQPLITGELPFLDRELEMEELERRVRTGDDTVLTIEGDPLVGKSAATAELVNSLLTGDGDAGRFEPSTRDFVCIDADDGCPSLASICGTLALETGEQALAAVPQAQKREALRAHLARSRTVLVLDNLRLADDRQSRELIDLLENLARGSLVIASVNAPGRLVAPRIWLPELDEDTVQELVEDRVWRFDVDGVDQFDKAFSKHLCELVGGNPGTIEWFLRGYKDSSQPLEWWIAALEHGAELTDLFGPTWTALDPQRRRVLEVCVFLDGEATAQQIGIAADRPVAAVEAAVEELRRENLLRPNRRKNRPTVFTCAKAFQRFVRSKTPASRRTEFAERLADHYVRHLTAHPEDATYGQWELDAMRIVRGQLLEDEDDGRIQGLFWVTLDILFTLGQFDELIAAAELTATSSAAAENDCGTALASVIKACTHAIRGEEGAAHAACAYGAEAAANSGLPGPIGRARRCRAFLHFRAGKPRQALKASEGVEELARIGNDPSTIVDVYDLRTAANWHLRRYRACEAAAHEALRAGEAIEWKRARSFPLRFLAELAIQRRQWSRAEELVEEAGDIAEEFGDLRQQARVELTRARLGLLSGRLEAGDAAARRAVGATTRLGLPPERQEAGALVEAIGRARRSRLLCAYYRLRRPSRLSRAPVGGD